MPGARGARRLLTAARGPTPTQRSAGRSPGVLFGEIDRRFGEIAGRFGEVEGRFGEVEGRLGEMDGRFSRQLGELHRRISTLIAANAVALVGVIAATRL